MSVLLSAVILLVQPIQVPAGPVPATFEGAKIFTESSIDFDFNMQAPPKLRFSAAVSVAPLSVIPHTLQALDATCQLHFANGVDMPVRVENLRTAADVAVQFDVVPDGTMKQYGLAEIRGIGRARLTQGSKTVDVTVPIRGAYAYFPAPPVEQAPFKAGDRIINLGEHILDFTDDRGKKVLWGRLMGYPLTVDKVAENGDAVLKMPSGLELHTKFADPLPAQTVRLCPDPDPAMVVAYEGKTVYARRQGTSFQWSGHQPKFGKALKVRSVVRLASGYQKVGVSYADMGDSMPVMASDPYLLVLVDSDVRMLGYGIYVDKWHVERDLSLTAPPRSVFRALRRLERGELMAHKGWSHETVGWLFGYPAIVGTVAMMNKREKWEYPTGAATMWGARFKNNRVVSLDEPVSLP